MPPQCVAPGCNNLFLSGLSMFSFPKDNELNLKWRVNMNRGKCLSQRHLLWKSTKYSRLCQEHFSDDCFVISPRLAADLGFKPGKFLLKKNAVPKIFKSTILKEQQVRGAFGKRQRQEAITQILEENSIDYDTSVISTPLPDSRESISVEERIPLCTIEPMNCLVQDEILKSVEKNNRTKKWCHKGCQTPVKWTSKLPVPVRSYSTQTKPLMVDQGTQYDPPISVAPSNPKVMDEDASLDDSFQTDNSMTIDEDLEDIDYLPDLDFDEMEEEEEEEKDKSDSPHRERKFIVFESALMELFSTCKVCAAKSSISKKRTVGTLLVVETIYYIDKLMDEVMNRRKTLKSYKECREDLENVMMSTPKPVCHKYPDIDKEAVVSAHKSRFGKKLYQLTSLEKNK